jgi:hypothetical protein
LRKIDDGDFVVLEVDAEHAFAVGTRSQSYGLPDEGFTDSPFLAFELDQATVVDPAHEIAWGVLRFGERRRH